MTINYPGPYEVRIHYTSNLYKHTQRLNVKLSTDPAPGTTFDLIDALRRDDAELALDSQVDAWINLIKAIYNTTQATFDYAELWKYEPQSFDASFISAYAISVAGTSATTATLGGQYVATFRTTEGGVMRLSFEEAAIAAGVPQPYGSMSAAMQAIVDAVQLGTSVWLARDSSYPFVLLRGLPGVNERTWKKRYREGFA